MAKLIHLLFISFLYVTLAWTSEEDVNEESLFNSVQKILNNPDLPKEQQLLKEKIEASRLLGLKNKSLNLSSLEITDEETKLLASIHWDELQILNLNHIKMSQQDLITFLLSSSWPTLENLSLVEINIESDEIDKIISSLNNRLPSLKQLYLGKSLVKDSGASCLASIEWTYLWILDLNHNDIGNEGAIEIAKGKWLALQELHLAWNTIADEGVASLGTGQWPLLRTLALNNNQIGNEGPTGLGKGQWPVLKNLYLNHNQIGDEGAAGLSKSQWPALEELHLENNQINSNGAKGLASAQWPSLITLYLAHNNIEDDGAKALVGQRIHKKWPQLNTLNLKENLIQESVILLYKQRNITPDNLTVHASTNKQLDVPETRVPGDLLPQGTHQLPDYALNAFQLINTNKEAREQAAQERARQQMYKTQHNQKKREMFLTMLHKRK